MGSEQTKWGILKYLSDEISSETTRSSDPKDEQKKRILGRKLGYDNVSFNFFSFLFNCIVQRFQCTTISKRRTKIENFKSKIGVWQCKVYINLLQLSLNDLLKLSLHEPT